MIILFLSCSCIPRGVPFYVGVVTPFIVCSIATGVTLIITGIILARISLKSLVSQEFLSSLCLFLLFTIGWTMVVSKANASSDSVAAALEAVFLLVGAPLGFYTFLLSALASVDVRSIWQKNFGKVLKKYSMRLSESKEMQSSVKKESVKDASNNSNNNNNNNNSKERIGSPIQNDNASISSDIDV